MVELRRRIGRTESVSGRMIMASRPVDSSGIDGRIMQNGRIKYQRSAKRSVSIAVRRDGAVRGLRSSGFVTASDMNRKWTRQEKETDPTNLNLFLHAGVSSDPHFIPKGP